MATHLKDLYETLETARRPAHPGADRAELRRRRSSAARWTWTKSWPTALTKTIEVLDMDAGAVFRIEPDAQEMILVDQQGLSPEMAALIEHAARLNPASSPRC